MQVEKHGVYFRGSSAVWNGPFPQLCRCTRGDKLQLCLLRTSAKHRPHGKSHGPEAAVLFAAALTNRCVSSNVCTSSQIFTGKSKNQSTSNTPRSRTPRPRQSSLLRQLSLPAAGRGGASHGTPARDDVPAADLPHGRSKRRIRVRAAWSFSAYRPPAAGSEALPWLPCRRRGRRRAAVPQLALVLPRFPPSAAPWKASLVMEMVHRELTPDCAALQQLLVSRWVEKGKRQTLRHNLNSSSVAAIH